MTQTITATFENGVLKPAQPLDLPEHAKVRITFELVDEAVQSARNQETLAVMESLWKSASVQSTEPPLTREQLHERR
jgi:predicted DNA-binding antitoxin AbrB/MazE fold protein